MDHENKRPNFAEALLTLTPLIPSFVLLFVVGFCDIIMDVSIESDAAYESLRERIASSPGDFWDAAA